MLRFVFCTTLLPRKGAFTVPLKCCLFSRFVLSRFITPNLCDMESPFGSESLVILFLLHFFYRDRLNVHCFQDEQSTLDPEDHQRKVVSKVPGLNLHSAVQDDGGVCGG